ncbi:uncharacterized protein LOC116774800 [Danaus plexippus]|uniref:Osiris 9 n=2 Tax=Danaus plexippus plexippus TaxID=278856 RepID=A0A212FC98_DANPL|nr:uncharacterized protein LOC116774800 [Danaus plexippus]OWR51343.1 osiris 9 precursor [Danaus plexippus plexippus]
MKVAVFVLLALGALARADDSDNTLETAINFVKDCRGDYILCVKEKLLRIVDNLRAARSVAIAEGVVLKGEPDVRAGKKLDTLPVDPTARDAEVNYRLVDGVVSLFETHALEVKMNQADKEEMQRSLEEGRGKKKGGSGLGAIIGLLGAKVLLGKLFIVKLIALKALATAKIALVLAVILFVAWCLKQEHTKTTYEVVPHHHESHPVHIDHLSHDVSHGHGFSGYGSDWNKNIDDAQNLAYGAYAPHK